MVPVRLASAIMRAMVRSVLCLYMIVLLSIADESEHQTYAWNAGLGSGLNGSNGLPADASLAAVDQSVREMGVPGQPSAHQRGASRVSSRDRARVMISQDNEVSVSLTYDGTDPSITEPESETDIADLIYQHQQQQQQQQHAGSVPSSMDNSPGQLLSPALARVPPALLRPASTGMSRSVSAGQIAGNTERVSNAAAAHAASAGVSSSMPTVASDGGPTFGVVFNHVTFSIQRRSWRKCEVSTRDILHGVTGE